VGLTFRYNQLTIMKKIVLLGLILGMGTLGFSQTRFGFVAKDYDNFSNSDASASVELIVWPENSDTLDFEVGATVSNQDGSALNGIHYNFTPLVAKFPAGTNQYDLSNRLLLPINLIPNSAFWGKKEFTLTLTNLIGVVDAQLLHNQKVLRVIIDYDGSSIGLPKLSVEEYSLYPVPASDKLYVGGVKAELYKVYDLSGRLVQEGPSTDNSIDVSSLMPGMYMLYAQTDRGMIIQKFIKN